jgi:glycosyltransferase involved in cell wall biosynthesis
MRRVLLTTHKFFPQHRAGTEVLTLKVAQDLQKRGYEVLVVTANPPDLDARHPSQTNTSDYVFEGVPVHVVEESLRLSGYDFAHEFVHTAIGEHFQKLLNDFKPDLVHIFHCQNLSASIIDVSIESKIPVLFSATDFWFVCPVVQLKRPDGALCRGPAKFAANCLTCYTPQLFPPAEQIQEAFEKKYRKVSETLKKVPALAQLAYNSARVAYISSKLPDAVTATVKRPDALKERLNQVQKIMVPTQLMADIFRENGINPKLIQHVPFGLDPSALLPYQKGNEAQTFTPTVDRPLRIGFIGTIFEHKGVDVLVKAFQALPVHSPAELTIYGDMKQFPDYASSIEKLIENSPQTKNRIKFAGTFPNQELGSKLQTIDVLVVPSRWYENTPLVIQSALTTRTPVIATDLGGMSELIHHNENGLLFPLNDHKALALEFLRLLEEPALLPTLMKNIKDERTMQQMVDEIETVYESLSLPQWSAKVATDACKAASE